MAEFTFILSIFFAGFCVKAAYESKRTFSEFILLFIIAVLLVLLAIVLKAFVL